MKRPTLLAGRPGLSGSATGGAESPALRLVCLFVVASVCVLAATSPTSVTRLGGKAFNASTMDLATQGYVEEEYLIQGTARTYDIPRDQMSNGTPSDATHPFKTRLVVRRPALPARFNGTVVV